MKLLIYIVAILVILSGVLGGGLYVNDRYQATAPTRVATTFIKNVSQSGKVAAAYAMTSAGYKNVVSYSTFSSDMSALAGSHPTFKNQQQTVQLNAATVTGEAQHLPVKNYNFVIQMSESSSKAWQVTAIIIN